ncbi:helix-turn-helix domain-containing protein [Coraliomargarita parva]|uniref:helix-turn-helix domain-containing protein n=1 Tax=Coraliomargarita parva TaxID=3014050 RepID=UPI0022B595E1|nr:AraC family transcriptional regulator [Coraliomargarita parva]
MNCWRNLPELKSIGLYVSPMGGAIEPAQVSKRHCRFEIILEGAVYGFEDEPVLHSEGSVFCHREGQLTVSESPDDSYYNCLTAEFACRPGEEPPTWPRMFYWSDRKAMHQFADEMLHAFHYAAMDRGVIGGLVLSRLRFELEQFRMHDSTQHLHPQLRRATDFINSHYALPVSLDDVAASAGVSVSHLHMLFREHLGESPHQYLIQKRMRAAGHALASTNAPIKVVAVECGYANTENFCRAFRKFYDRSATEYREAYTRSKSAVY